MHACEPSSPFVGERGPEEKSPEGGEQPAGPAVIPFAPPPAPAPEGDLDELAKRLMHAIPGTGGPAIARKCVANWIGLVGPVLVAMAILMAEWRKDTRNPVRSSGGLWDHLRRWRDEEWTEAEVRELVESHRPRGKPAAPPPAPAPADEPPDELPPETERAELLATIAALEAISRRTSWDERRLRMARAELAELDGSPAPPPPAGRLPRRRPRPRPRGRLPRRRPRPRPRGRLPRRRPRPRPRGRPPAAPRPRPRGRLPRRRPPVPPDGMSCRSARVAAGRWSPRSRDRR